MPQNEAKAFAAEIGGWVYKATPLLWRVIKRVDPYTIRVFKNRTEWQDHAYMAVAA